MIFYLTILTPLSNLLLTTTAERGIMMIKSNRRLWMFRLLQIAKRNEARTGRQLLPASFHPVSISLGSFGSIRVCNLTCRDSPIKDTTSPTTKNLFPSLTNTYISSRSYQIYRLLIRFLRFDYLVGPKRGEMCPIRYGSTSSVA